MATKKKRRNRRKETARPAYQVKATPTHYIRLSRRVVVVDPGRRWFVVRTVAKHEREVAARLERIAIERKVDFVIYRATEAVKVARRGATFESDRHPAVGYLFIGYAADADPMKVRGDLWAYSDAEVKAGREELFKRIIGPFGAKALQRCARDLERFSRRLTPPLVAELIDPFLGAVATFPGRYFGGKHGQTIHLTSVLKAA